MKRLRPSLLLSLLLGVLFFPAQASADSGWAAPPTHTDIASPATSGPVEIVVDADDSLSDAEVKAIGKRVGADLSLNSVYSDDANLYIATVPASRVKSILSSLSSIDGIEAAEVNSSVHAFNFPNDPLYQYQWHFKQINMPKAWTTATGKDVVVAVIDTGVAYKDSSDGRFKMAPDLKGTAFVKGYDFVSDDAEPLDEHGHGTHVAGTVAQTTNNGYGVAGVAYEAKIMPLRVLNANGSGSVGDIADSIRFAADNGAKVINMSLGGPLPSLVMRSAVRYAHSKGVTIVAAAGNSGRRMRSFPAAYDHVIAVAATQYDRKTTFYSQWGTFVDIAAPGGNTRIDQNGDGRPDGVMQQTIKPGDGTKHDFALYMGTSMASPHVAGVAALIVGMGTNNPDQVEAILKATANTDGKEKTKDYEERYGAGLLDAQAAVNHTAGCTGLGRSGLALLLTLFTFFFVRRRDPLHSTTSVSKIPFSFGLLSGSAGLFFLPLIVRSSCEHLNTAVNALSGPIATLDTALLGPSFHQNPLLASALIPFALIAVGLGNKTLRSLGIGLALGFSAFLFSEAFLLTSDVQWLPGLGILDRAWLAANGLFSLVLATLALKRDTADPAS